MENDNDKIRLLEFDTIIYFLMRGLCLGISINSCLEIAKVNAWISIIVGTIIGFIPICLFYNIQHHDKKKNTMDLNIDLFGIKIGKVVNIILTLFVTFILLVSLWNLTNFISSSYLYNTPQSFIIIIFMIPTIYLLSKNYKVIGRTLTIFFFIEIIIYILGVAGLITQVNINNIYPILESGISPILKASLIYVAYNVLPLFMTTIIPLDNIKYKTKKFNKNIIFTYLISSFSILIIIFLLISAFGIDLARLYQYQTFQLLRKAKFGGFIGRMEEIISIHWIISLFSFNFICFLFIKEGLQNIFSNNKLINRLYPILVITIAYTSTFIFRNNTLANIFNISYFNYFFGIFFLVLPIIILITGKRKSKR